MGTHVSVEIEPSGTSGNAGLGAGAPGRKTAQAVALRFPLVLADG